MELKNSAEPVQVTVESQRKIETSNHSPSTSETQFSKLIPSSPLFLQKRINAKMIALSTCKTSNFPVVDSYRSEDLLKSQETKVLKTSLRTSSSYQETNFRISTDSLLLKPINKVKPSLKIPKAKIEELAINTSSASSSVTWRIGTMEILSSATSRKNRLSMEINPKSDYEKSLFTTTVKNSTNLIENPNIKRLFYHKKCPSENLFISSPTLFKTEEKNFKQFPSVKFTKSSPRENCAFPVIKREGLGFQFNGSINKDILQRRLKKSAFPAFLAKQKAKKEIVESMGVRRFLENIGEEEQIQISKLKREKEVKRQKNVNTFATYNFNLFKPTTINNPPTAERDS